MNQATSYNSIVALVKECIQNSQTFPTLKQLSLNVIAILLWKVHGTEVSKLDKYITNTLFRDEMKITLRTKLLNAIKHLHIPRGLQCELQLTIELNGRQIHLLLSYLHDYYNLPNAWKKCDYVTGICWTPHGTIDIPATVEGYVTGKIVINHDDCLNMASDHCLERLMKTLQPLFKRWNKSANRGGYRWYLTQYWYNIYSTNKYLESFVPTDEDIEKLFSSGEDWWRHNTNTVAIEYFWSKMSAEGRIKIIAAECMENKWKTSTSYEANLYFWFTHLSEEQLDTFINLELPNILRCIVVSCSPWTKSFLSPHLFAVLDDKELAELLLHALRHFTLYNKQLESRIFFKKFVAIMWNAGSNGFKTSVAQAIKRDREFRIADLDLDILCLMFIDDLSQRERTASITKIFHKVIDYTRIIDWEDSFKYLLSKESVKLFLNELAVFGMRHIAELIPSAKYLIFFELCNLPEEELRNLKMNSCLYEILQFRLGTYRTFNDNEMQNLHEFLIWCLLPEEQIQCLEKLVEANNVDPDLRINCQQQ